MLDAFLAVAYDHETRHTENVKLAKVLKSLPIEDLQKLASGEAKLAFEDCDDSGDKTWIGKYKGTPLFDQALALEKADLEAEVARTQADTTPSPYEEMNKTRDNIRVQKKMLDLDLVEVMNGGASGPAQAGGQSAGPDQPMTVIPNADAQGSGAPGNAGGDEGPQKLSSFAARFEKAAISGGLIDKAVVNTVAKGALTPARAAHAAELGKKVMNKGVSMAGGMGKTTGGAAMSLIHQGAHMSDLASKMAMAKAALDMKGLGTAALNMAKAHPQAIGAGVGAVGGAIAGGPDHRLSGAAGGAALGAGAGHAASGIAGKMSGPGGKSLIDAAKSYGSGLAAKAKGAVMPAGNPAQYSVAAAKPPLPGGAGVHSMANRALDSIGGARGAV